MKNNISTANKERLNVLHVNALLKAAFEEALQQDIDEMHSDAELELMDPVISSLDKKIQAISEEAVQAYKRRSRQAGHQ